MNDTALTREKVERYLAITDEALSIAKIAVPENSLAYRTAQNFLEMINAYRKDAGHFLEKGDLVRAFGCINYAHGWLDAGARLGLFHHDNDDRLFTLAD